MDRKWPLQLIAFAKLVMFTEINKIRLISRWIFVFNCAIAQNSVHFESNSEMSFDELDAWALIESFKINFPNDPSPVDIFFYRWIDRDYYESSHQTLISFWTAYEPFLLNLPIKLLKSQ